MEKVYFKPYVTSGDKERMEKDLIRLTESRLRKQTMDRWELCTDCPYPARGFVCWSENQECLLTRMMVLDGREDEVKQITRLNRINEAIDPFRIYDFRNGTYAFVLRLSKFPPSMRISCQNSFNSFAEMHTVTKMVKNHLKILQPTITSTIMEHLDLRPINIPDAEVFASMTPMVWSQAVQQ